MKKRFNRNNVEINSSKGSTKKKNTENKITVQGKNGKVLSIDKAKKPPRANASNNRAGSKSRSVTYRPSLFEIISKRDIMRIHQKDYPTVEGTAVDANVNNLYVMLNVWLNLVIDFGVDHRHILNAIFLYGIKNVFKDLEAYRYAVLTGTEKPKYSWLVFLEALPVKTVSQICGFPKRTLIETGSEYEYWCDFKATNKEMSDRTYSWYLVAQLSEKISYLIDGYFRNDNAFILPPGATVENASTYIEKFHVAVEHSNQLKAMGVNLPIFHGSMYKEPDIPDYCQYNTVPKNAFKRRGIAKESVVRQIVAYQIDSGMRMLLPLKGIYLDDQERNQFAAFVGSLPRRVAKKVIKTHPLAGKYPEMVDAALKGRRVATVDLSAASDSVRTQLVVDTISGDLYEDLYLCRSRYVKYISGNREESICSNRWSTMGSAVTFFLETIMFRGIKLLAYDYYNLFVDPDKRISPLEVDYGDDGCIDPEVAPIYLDLLTAFGFTVNQEKTFITGAYRESCGVEYLNGEDVTINFFPRGTSRYELPQLVALQHKLYTYPRANGFLVECVRQLAPNITESAAGSNHDDLWSDRYTREPVRNSWYVKQEDCYRLKWAVVRNDNPLKLKHENTSASSFLKWEEWSDDIEISDAYWRLLPSEYSTCAQAESAAAQLLELFYDHFDRNKYTLVIVCIASEKSYDCRLSGDPTDITNHTCFTVNLKPFNHVKDWDVERECELLMYLLTIGGGIEHVNNSPFTDPRDFIRDRRSLVQKGQFQIATSISFD